MRHSLIDQSSAVFHLCLFFFCSKNYAFIRPEIFIRILMCFVSPLKINEARIKSDSQRPSEVFRAILVKMIRTYLKPH